MSDPLAVDHHVHSTFSADADATILENLAAARKRGLTRVCFVEHVRASTTWVPVFARAVRVADQLSGGEIDVRSGVEASIVDSGGTLDLPPELPTVDRVLLADHEYPAPDGPMNADWVRLELEIGRLTAGEVVDTLVEATMAAMRRVARPQLAHLFSLLPRLGLNEDVVGDDHLRALATRARIAVQSSNATKSGNAPALGRLRRLSPPGSRWWRAPAVTARATSAFMTGSPGLSPEVAHPGRLAAGRRPPGVGGHGQATYRTVSCRGRDAWLRRHDGSGGARRGHDLIGTIPDLPCRGRPEARPTRPRAGAGSRGSSTAHRRSVTGGRLRVARTDHRLSHLGLMFEGDSAIGPGAPPAADLDYYDVRRVAGMAMQVGAGELLLRRSWVLHFGDRGGNGDGAEHR